MICSCAYCKDIKYVQAGEKALRYPLILRLVVPSECGMVGLLACTDKKDEYRFYIPQRERVQKCNSLSELTSTVLRSNGDLTQTGVDISDESWTVNINGEPVRLIDLSHMHMVQGTRTDPPPRNVRFNNVMASLKGGSVKNGSKKGLARTPKSTMSVVSKKRGRESQTVPVRKQHKAPLKADEESEKDEEEDGVEWEYDVSFNIEDSMAKWNRNTLENYLRKPPAERTALPRLLSIEKYFPCRFHPQGNPTLDVVLGHPITNDTVRVELGATVLYRIPEFQTFVSKALALGQKNGGITGST